MKKNVLIMMIAVAIIGLSSCKKEDNGSSQGSVEASKSTKINKGEPVSFKFSKAPEDSTVQWSVAPNKDVIINASGNIASILFANAGSYTVNAMYGTLIGTLDVSVQDSIYNPGSGGSPTIVTLTGDQIAVSVTKIPDSMGFVGLNLAFLTKNKYKCLNNTLLFTRGDLSSNNITTYTIEFTGVEIPSDDFCASGEDYSKGITGFFPVADGESILEIILDGVTYAGTISKTGSTLTITWNYSNGVTISPFIIN